MPHRYRLCTDPVIQAILCEATAKDWYEKAELNHDDQRTYGMLNIFQFKFSLTGNDIAGIE